MQDREFADHLAVVFQKITWESKSERSLEKHPPRREASMHFTGKEVDLLDSTRNMIVRGGYSYELNTRLYPDNRLDDPNEVKVLIFESPEKDWADEFEPN